jgi:hemoglobin/transferrin/lactoferrin receptor protein
MFENYLNKSPMKVLAVFCITFLTITAEIFPQTITITDNEEHKPVADVAILNPSKTRLVYSNRSGKAEISAFNSDEMICFQHFSFERICLNMNDLKKSDYKITLTRKVFPMNEFVISANKWEQSKSEVPNKISSILSPQIRFQNPQTAADLIASSDEVFVQKSQLGGGSPMIRGFSTNRILIVVDGVRMNNAIYREGNIQNVISLDPAAIESAEIIFGPGASIYGSDAIGGVMDFHTKKALLSTGEKLYFKTDAFTRYSSANKEKTGHLDFSIGSKKAAFLSSLSYSDFDNLKMGSKGNSDYVRPEYIININGKDSIVANPDPRVQIFSGYNQINLMNKLRLKVSDKIDLILTNHYSALSNVPRYDRLIQYKSGKLRYGDWYYGPQVWIMNNIQLTLTGKNKIYDEVRIIAAQQNYKESRHDRSFSKSSVNEQFEKAGILSLNIDFDKKIEEEAQLLYYGIELVNNNIKSVADIRDINTGIITPAGTRYPNGKNLYNSVSVYAGYKNNLSERLTINTGLRYNHATLNSTIADNSYYNFPFTRISISNGALTGSAGLVYRMKKNFQINLNTSTGFRAPNLDDAGKVFDSAPGMVVVPNPDLKPEYAYNADLGISKDFGRFIHFEITGFFTWLKNAMVRHDFLFNGADSIDYGGTFSKVEAIVNAGYARVYGASVNLQANLLKNLILKSSLNITEGKEMGGIPLRHATPVFGTTHFIYETAKIKADLYSVYNGAKTFKNMAPSETAKPYMYATDKEGNPWSPGWYTINFKVSYDFSKWGIFNAGIENILDNRYRPYSSGIVAPGRNYIVSLRVII